MKMGGGGFASAPLIFSAANFGPNWPEVTFPRLRHTPRLQTLCNQVFCKELQAYLLIQIVHLATVKVLTR